MHFPTISSLVKKRRTAKEVL